LEVLVWQLMWRLTFWLIAILLRLFWLPLLIIGLVYFIALPALAAIAQLVAVVLQPAAVLAAAIFLLWLLRR
jgi:hypothetical protein